MLARLRALVGGRKPTEAAAAVVTDALPPEVQTVIGGAMVIERNGTDENNPRLLVHTARGSFFRDEKQPRAWLASSWPELNDAQRVRALRMLDARIAEAQREHAAAAAASRSGPRWKDWQPAGRPWPGA